MWVIDRLCATGQRLGCNVTWVLCTLIFVLALNPYRIVENMAAHRANTLLSILPNALETGFSEVFPENEPLKVRLDNIEVEAH